MAKRIIVNFDPATEFTANSDSEFNNVRQRYTQNGQRVFYEIRSDIYCVEPTIDTVMYYNYIRYLNRHANEWKYSSAKYFGLGIIPYIMLPMFRTTKEQKDFTDVNAQKRLDLNNLLKGAALEFARIKMISIPSIKFTRDELVGKSMDMWIFRKDMLYMSNLLAEVNPKWAATTKIKDLQSATLENFLCCNIEAAK